MATVGQMEDMRGYESALGVCAVQVQGAPWVLQLGHEVGPVVEGVRHERRQEAAPPHCVVHSATEQGAAEIQKQVRTALR